MPSTTDIDELTFHFSQGLFPNAIPVEWAEGKYCLHDFFLLYIYTHLPIRVKGEPLPRPYGQNNFALFGIKNRS
jgi:hypothetical protein